MNAVEDQSRPDEVEQYLDGVRASLADLPADAREELLEDLPAHLADVLAEGTGSLTDRLGTPAGYAAELRAAAGLGTPVEHTRAKGWINAERMAALRRRLAERLSPADRQVGKALGYAGASEFLPLLRPAWWVLRGYVAAVIVIESLLAHTNAVLDWLVIAVVVLVSVRLGSTTRPLPRAVRFVGLGANTVLAIVALGYTLAHGASPLGGPDFSPAQTGYGRPYDEPYAEVVDVYPFDRDGKPLTHVRLYDQTGQPLNVGDWWRCHSTPADSTSADSTPPGDVPDANAYEYPLCPFPLVPTGPSSPSPAAQPPSEQQTGPTGSPGASTTGTSPASPAATPTGRPSATTPLPRPSNPG